MLDLTSPKVITPALMFALLSPGMLLQLPASSVKGAFFTQKTDMKSVAFHALVFLIVYRLIAQQMGLVLTRTDLIVPVVMFMLLSPGMLLTIPGGKGTSVLSVAVHTVVFAAVFALLRKQFPRYY